MPEPLSPMLRAYLECALWSSTDNSRDDGGDPLDANFTIDDFAPEALASARADVETFESAHAADLDADGTPDRSHAGHDLWLTRNGHGAGFWNGDWPEPQASRLTDAAHALGTSDAYIGDDGAIHLSR